MVLQTFSSPATNASLLRKLSSLPVVPAATVFTTLTEDDLQHILPPLLSNLTPPLAQSLLQSLINFARYTPPNALKPFWSSTCHQLLSLVRRAHVTAFVPLAAFILAGRRMDLRGDLVDISRSALVHAVRVLQKEDIRSNTGIVESLAVVSAVLSAAPKELRSCSGKLHTRLREMIQSDDEDVRKCAEHAYVELITCFSDSMQENFVCQEVNAVCSDIDSVLEFLRLFSGNGKTNDTLRTLNFETISTWFETLCRILPKLLSISTISINIPISPVVKLLCKGLEDIHVDPYQTVEAAVNHDSIYLLSPIIFKNSLQALLKSVQIFHHQLLPVLHTVGECFSRNLSQMVIKCDESSIGYIEQRYLMYSAIRDLLGTIDGVFIEYIIERFQELFQGDLELYKKVLQQVQQRKPTKVEGWGKSRKRRRHGGSREKTQENASETPVQQTFSDGTLESIEKLLQEGFRTCTALFRDRSLLSKTSEKCLERLETGLISLIENSEVSPDLLTCVNAAACGGGSRRMNAEASILLFPCLKLCNRVLENNSATEELRKTAVFVRAQCEALTHPRGPPAINRATRMFSKEARGKENHERDSAVRKRRRISDGHTMPATNPPQQTNNSQLSTHPKANNSGMNDVHSLKDGASNSPDALMNMGEQQGNTRRVDTTKEQLVDVRVPDEQMRENRGPPSGPSVPSPNVPGPNSKSDINQSTNEDLKQVNSEGHPNMANPMSSPEYTKEQIKESMDIAEERPDNISKVMPSNMEIVENISDPSSDEESGSDSEEEKAIIASINFETLDS